MAKSVGRPRNLQSDRHDDRDVVHKQRAQKARKILVLPRRIRRRRQPQRAICGRERESELKCGRGRYPALPAAAATRASAWPYGYPMNIFNYIALRAELGARGCRFV